jgi:hypothetical protein
METFPALRRYIVLSNNFLQNDNNINLMIFIAAGGVFNLMGFSMASRSPGNENNLIY